MFDRNNHDLLSPWTRRLIHSIRGTFFNDLPAKIIALLFGTLIWLLAASEVVYEYQTNLPVQVDGLPEDLILLNELPGELTVKLMGKGRDLFQLNFGKQPAILRINEPAVGKSYQPVSPENVTMTGGTDVALMEIVRPAYLNLEFDEISTKKLPVDVPITGALLPDLVLKERITWEPERVDVRGPSRFLSNLEEIESDTLDLSRIIVSTAVSLPLTNHPRARLLTIDPDTVVAQVNVEQLLTFEYKNVPIKLVNGDPEQIDFMPKTVNVKVTVPDSKSRPYKDLVNTDIQAVVDARFLNETEMNLPIRVTTPTDLFNDAQFDPESILVFEK